MTDRQLAALWWRQLFSELGTTADTGAPGLPGQLAKARHKAVTDLFFDLVSRPPIDCLIEVGAHYAETSKQFVTSKPGARAIAYEAAPEIYERAIARGLPGRVTMYNCAVGAEPGTATLFLPRDQNLQVWASTRRRAGDVDVREVIVPMVSLDIAGRAMAGTGGDRDLAIWIDVEGTALDVLRGGQDLFRRRIAVAYMEINDVSAYDGAATSLDIIALLLKLGFIPVARDNEYHDAWNLLAVHEDTHYAAREAIAAWFYAAPGSAASSRRSSDADDTAMALKVRFHTVRDAVSDRPVSVGDDGRPVLLPAVAGAGRPGVLVSWKHGTKGALIALPGISVVRADPATGVLVADRQDVRDHEVFDLVPAAEGAIHMMSFWGKYARLTHDGAIDAGAETESTGMRLVLGELVPTPEEIHGILSLPSLESMIG
jgi:FkbM family methyltransferase